jgi:hypothetical protein
MTKKDFTDYFKMLLSRVDKTNKYHPEVIAYSVERAVNNVLCDLYLKFPNLVDPYIKTYIDQVASNNKDTGLWEIRLPVSYVPLPVVGSGVREVAAMTDTFLTFIPITYEDLMRTIDLNTKYLSTVIYYAVVGDLLILSGEPSEHDGLRIRLLTSFTDYTDTDTFIVPYGQDMTIMQNVYQILGLIQPIDLNTNNSDYGRGQRIDNRR